MNRFWSKSYLRDVSGGTAEALKFGAALFVINFVLDAVIYRVLFMSENYFSFLSIWPSYLLMLVIPVLISKRL